MKKLLSTLLACLVVAGSLSACKRTTPEPEPSSSAPEEPPVVSSIYQDGAYSVKYSVPAGDSTLDYLTISVLDDEITVQDYGFEPYENPDASEPADESEAAAQPEPSSSSEPEGEDTEPVDYAAEIKSAYRAADGDLDTIEPVEGAEEHSYRFVRMMRTALESAKEGNTSTVTIGTRFLDGNYEGRMESANRDGWQEFVTLTVEGGEITEIIYNASGEEDSSKLITEDSELNAQADGPADYYPAIAQGCLDNGGDFSNMTAPTNGGAATKTFGKLMRALTAQMTSGGERKIAVSRLADGLYTARFADFDENGWKEYVVLKIKNGKVTVDEFDAISEKDDAARRSADTALSDRMREATGLSYSDAVSALVNNWEKAENDVTQVDNVAGATVSSNSFKLLVGQLLATAAVEGNAEVPIEVERLPEDAEE